MAKCLVVHTTLKYFKYMVAKRQYYVFSKLYIGH